MSIKPLPMDLLLVAMISAAWSSSCDDGHPNGDVDVDADPDAEVDGGVDAPYQPTGWCPGQDGCHDEGDNELYVGVSEPIDITPEIDERHPIWLGGFDQGRQAVANTDVNDRLEARALALRYNETTVVLVSIDCLALFNEDVMRIRELVRSPDIDYISVTATRTHSAPDTLGFWGPTIFEPGVDQNYMNLLRGAAADAVEAATENLEPASVESTSFRLGSARLGNSNEGGMLRFFTDTRDPKIIDDEVRLMRFVSDHDSTIATMINVSVRSDYSGAGNQVISADIGHHIRRVLVEGFDPTEQGGSDAPLLGLGGVALFFPGAFGCQVGSGESRTLLSEAGMLHPRNWDGSDYPSDGSLELAELVGTQIGYLALRALQGDVAHETPAVLEFRYQDFRIEVENSALHAAFDFGLMPNRAAYDYDPMLPTDESNTPWIQTQIALISIGEARIVTIPGHLDPALFINGYADHTYRPEGVDFVDADRCTEPPPDTPPEDYQPLRELFDASQVFLFGVTNDELGYFILPNDFVIDGDPSRAYLYMPEEYCHYEETFALSPSAWPTIEEKLQSLIDWQPPGESR